MFFCPYKNSYLQLNKAAGGINPRLINRAVNEALSWDTDSHDKDLPFNRLTSNQPCLPTTYQDFLCRAHAFGNWALRKLIRELHSECPQTVSNAIDTLMEEVREPRKVIEAVELKLVKRVADLMLDNDPSIRERICIILNTISNQEFGRGATCQSQIVLKNILQLLKDPVQMVRYKAATLANTLSNNYYASFALIDLDYIDVINQRILMEENLVLVPLLKTMNNLMQGEGKNIAYAIGVFQTMVELLSRTHMEVLEATLNCIMILLTLKCAKKESVNINLLETLNNKLNDPVSNIERPQYLTPDYKESFKTLNRSEVYTAASGAIMNATHRTQSKKQSVKIDGLLDRLVTLLKDKYNPRVQMWSIKALTNLAEYPPNRQYLKEHHLNVLNKLPINPDVEVTAKNVETYQNKLIEIINWKP